MSDAIRSGDSMVRVTACSCDLCAYRYIPSWGVFIFLIYLPRSRGHILRESHGRIRIRSKRLLIVICTSLGPRAWNPWGACVSNVYSTSWAPLLEALFRLYGEKSTILFLGLGNVVGRVIEHLFPCAFVDFRPRFPKHMYYDVIFLLRHKITLYCVPKTWCIKWRV